MHSPVDTLTRKQKKKKRKYSAFYSQKRPIISLKEAKDLQKESTCALFIDLLIVS